MDDDRLAEAFDALASSTRLNLLRVLRFPSILSHIEVRSSRREGDANIARQSVAKHLERLTIAGLVSTHDIVFEGKDTVQFSVNHQALYTLAEAVRALAKMRPAAELDAPTVQGPARATKVAERPLLVMVKGLDEGSTFSLVATAEKRAWMIGRRRDSDIALDFDQLASAEHARIRWNGKAHEIEDAGSRNGTSVNFAPLSTEAPRALQHGDVVGVGRCLFVYWT